MSSDRIVLAGLRFHGHHGVTPEERSVGGAYEMDLELVCDLRRAAESDGLEDTVDYSLVREAALAVALGPSCALLETLAERTAAAVLGAFPSAERVRIRVRKSTPPGMPDVAWAGVEIERDRGWGKDPA